MSVIFQTPGILVETDNVGIYPGASLYVTIGDGHGDHVFLSEENGRTLADALATHYEKDGPKRKINAVEADAPATHYDATHYDKVDPKRKIDAVENDAGPSVGFEISTDRPQPGHLSVHFSVRLYDSWSSLGSRDTWLEEATS